MKYGWKRQKFDDRDELFRFTPPDLALPPSVDLSDGLPACYDQGQLGSCTANAIAGALQFEMGKDKDLPNFMPSRLFIYWQERFLEGTVNDDAGAEIRDGIKCVASFGVPSENEWPYIESRFADKPGDDVIISAGTFEAFTNKKILYQTISQDVNHLKACLASGWPFLFGFDVYPAFESEEVAQTGIVPMPGPGERSIGGHAVLAVGCDDSKQAFKVRNSWGQWGLKGHFWLPYAYIQGLSSDFWKVSLVVQAGA